MTVNDKARELRYCGHGRRAASKIRHHSVAGRQTSERSTLIGLFVGYAFSSLHVETTFFVDPLDRGVRRFYVPFNPAFRWHVDPLPWPWGFRWPPRFCGARLQ